jgi:Ca2+-binding RTX toxin-like protein
MTINFANAKSSSSLGVTNMKSLGGKIKGLETPPSSVQFGNTITCKPLVSCFGTNRDDIILPGMGSLVFGLKGNDVMLGALNNQLYGDDGNDIITLGGGHTIGNGGSGADSLFGGLGTGILIGGPGNDKEFGGASATIMTGNGGANHFDCPLSVGGLARSVVLDYNPSNGDTISGSCSLVNTIGNNQNNNSVPNIGLPETGDTSSASPSPTVGGGQ